MYSELIGIFRDIFEDESIVATLELTDAITRENSSTTPFDSRD